MTLRTLQLVVSSLLCLGLGCGPSGRPTAPLKVHRVSLNELVRAYRTAPSERRYDGRTVQVYVPAGTGRKFEADYVDAFKMFEQQPGCVRFYCSTKRLDPTTPITVTGVCRGQVTDGFIRSGGVDWHIRVEDCQVTSSADLEE